MYVYIYVYIYIYIYPPPPQLGCFFPPGMRRPRNLVNFPRLVNLRILSFLADNLIFCTSESKIMHVGSPRNLVNFPRLVSEPKLRCHVYHGQLPNARVLTWQKRSLRSKCLALAVFPYLLSVCFPGGGVPVLPAVVSQRHCSNASVHLSMILFQCCTLFFSMHLHSKNAELRDASCDCMCTCSLGQSQRDV